MSPRALRVIVMHVSNRCDQACEHCSIWKEKGRVESLGLEDRLRILSEAKSLGARSVLFTGGEPFLCDHLQELCGAAHHLGLSVQIATNGLGLARAARWLSPWVNEIYVSLEGPPEIHDSVRGRGMFSRLAAALATVRSLSRRPRLVGRSVISARNAAVVESTVDAARALGLDAISFLPIDTASGAFGGDPGARVALSPGRASVNALRGAIAALEVRGELGRFVSEDARKLGRLADSFEAEESGRVAPACDAPEWSSVVEADGRVRPCFFQPVVGRVGAASSLAALRGSDSYRDALGSLGRDNGTCQTCVCPKRMAGEGLSVSARMGAALERALPRWLAKEGVSA